MLTTLPQFLHFPFNFVKLKCTANYGSMPEWLKGADCKSAGLAYAGSNPARPNFKFFKLILFYGPYNLLFLMLG